MQRISVDLSRTLQPEMIVVIYNENAGNKSGTYVEVAPVRKSGKDYVPLSAVPLSKTGLKRLKEIVDADNSTIQVQRQILPPNVLFYDFSYGSRVVCWHITERRRMIEFSKSTGLESGYVKVPKMIFLTTGEDLRVYCYRNGIRPTPKTQLYQAPFMNTSQASVCLGMNQLSKSVDLMEIIKRAEAVFFEAPFTHVSGTAYPNMKELWQEALKTGTFPESKLRESAQTLQGLL